MKTIVIAAPDQLPPEMADDPSVLVLDPASLDEELMSMLEAASGGMLGEDEDESGEGALSDWAAEEEQEHAHAKGGYGDEDEDEERQMSGEGDDEDEDESGEGDDAMHDPETKFGKMGYGKMGRGGRAGEDEERDEESGEGMEEDIDESKAPSKGAMGYGKMGRGKGGKGLPPLAAWARSMGGMGRR